MTSDLVSRRKSESKPARELSPEQAAAAAMVAEAKARGLELTGPNGLLKLFTKNVLETALNEELTENLSLGASLGANCGLGVRIMRRLPSPLPLRPQVVVVSDVTGQAHNPSGRGFEPPPALPPEQRDTIRTPGGSLQVRVYAGQDPITRRDRYLSATIKGTDRVARRKAEKALTRLQDDADRNHAPDTLRAPLSGAGGVLADR